MADFFAQTVIRPDIPRTAMTMLEYKVLCQMFDHEDVGDDVYFCASHGPNDLLYLATAEVKALLAEEEGIGSGLADLVREEIAKCEPDDVELELDMSAIGFEGIFQDIVQRSALDYLEVEAAWHSTNMPTDGLRCAPTRTTE